MNVAVTAYAAPSKIPPVGRVVKGGRGMLSLVMALLAQPRGTNSQQSDIVAPVRHVTVPAVFSDRWMFIQKRPAFIHMAAIAVLVDTVLRYQLLGDRAMSVVAVGTL